MTEGEWRAALSPISPLHWLFFQTPAERKLRLFSVACCRRAGYLLSPRLFHLLAATEVFAEGRSDEVALRATHREEWRRHTQQPAGTELSDEVPAAVAACLYASADVERDRDWRRYNRDRLTPDCVRVAWQV